MIKAFPLVMTDETHAKYEAQAREKGKSLKAWIFEAMEEKLEREKGTK